MFSQSLRRPRWIAWSSSNTTDLVHRHQLVLLHAGALVELQLVGVCVLVQNRVQYSTVQYSTVQYSTWYSAVSLRSISAGSQLMMGTTGTWWLSRRGMDTLLPLRCTQTISSILFTILYLTFDYVWVCLKHFLNKLKRKKLWKLKLMAFIFLLT